jgi:CelD/BcsL family acetyltransferase involved in cellulose biosynthesis
MRVEVVDRRDALQPLAARWDELARQDSRDGFFRTYIWYKAWLQHIRPDAEPFVLVARDSHGVVRGLAPLCRLPYKDLGFRLSAVAWAGREVVSGDFLDFLADNDVRAEVLETLLGFLASADCRWSLLVLGELVDGSDSYRALEKMAATQGLAVRRQEERICPFISLPATLDEYLAGLGSSTRYHIRRRMRDVEKKGATVETHTGREEVASRLDTLVRLHLARWRRDDLPGTFGRPGFVDFLKEVFLNPPAGSSCRLYELVHNGQPAASLLTFYFGESALYYQAGWDPDSSLAALSPGVVVMAHSIQDAMQHHLRYYEFLRGDEAYKSRWTKTYRTTATLLLARGGIARGYLHTAGFKDSIKHHLLHKAKPAPGSAEPISNLD